MKRLIRFLSKWAWHRELQQLDTLSKERDEMLEGLERCGWPCQLVELPEYYLRVVHAYDTEVLQVREMRKIKAES